MLVLVLALECLSLTGLRLHEWIGFGLCPLMFLHVVLQWEWFCTQFRRIRMPGVRKTRINSLLNVVLLVLAAATLISGILISHQAVPLLGEGIGRIHVWIWVHDCVNNFLVGLISLHLALNWNWLGSVIRLRNSSPLADRFDSQDQSELSWFRGVLDHLKFRRSLAVFAVSWLSAFAAYFVFVPIAREPQNQFDVKYHHIDNTSSNKTMETVPLRNGRPFSLRNSTSELAFAVVLLLSGVIIGRFVLKLRL